MSSRRCRLAIGLGSVLLTLAALAAAAQGPSPKPTPPAPDAAQPGAAAAASLIQLVRSPQASAPTRSCADPLAQLSTRQSTAATSNPLEVRPWSARQTLCTPPHCPTGYSYDCFCRTCYKCPPLTIFNEDICRCDYI